MSKIEDLQWAVFRAALEIGFDEGFAMSCEGWNGEHPGDAEITELYENKKREIIQNVMRRFVNV